MSVYMPVNTNEFRDEFNNVLDEIDSLCLQYSDYDLIIGGDFNCAFERGDERSEVLSAWVRNRELSCPALQPHAPWRPTHNAHDGRSSLLDYIFLSERFYRNLCDWDVYESGDNLSDHSPTMVSLNIQKEVFTTPDIPLSRSK